MTQTKVKNNNGEFTVFMDPDPFHPAVIAETEEIFTVQVINEEKRNDPGQLFVGVSTDGMDRTAAIKLYRAVTGANDPEAYLRGAIRKGA